MYKEFIETISTYYAEHARKFAWRNTITPYTVVVSEIMLQQTQTDRVEKKFKEWLILFPDFASLASAPQSAVLTAWSGLGYNRRALYLHKIAQRIMIEFNGQLPHNPTILKTFPGVGPNTAGSICAFVFNTPTVFIETNIRTVFIYFFFKNHVKVHDNELLPLIAATIDHEKPREWYYALMDYGVMLKKKHKNPSRKSIHHTTQSKFEGSERQIRGLILKHLTTVPCATFDDLCEIILKEPLRIAKNLKNLCIEGFVKKENQYYLL